MRLDPARLLILDAVARCGGVVSAAAELHLVPSGVSQHLAALERESGLTLVDRSRRGRPATTLTAAGRRLADHAAVVALALRTAEDDLDAYLGEIRGTIRISAIPSVLAPLVVPAVRVLAEWHPAIRPQLSDGFGSAAISLLNADELDLMIAEADGAASAPVTDELQAHRIADDPYRLVIPSIWPPPRSLADLADRPWIAGPPDSAAAGALDHLRRDTGAPLRAVHSCLEFPAVLALVAAGLGVALVPALALVDRDLHGVQVVTLPGLGSRTVIAVHSARRPLRPPTKAMLDALAQVATETTDTAVDSNPEGPERRRGPRRPRR